MTLNHVHKCIKPCGYNPKIASVVDTVEFSALPRSKNSSVLLRLSLGGVQTSTERWLAHAGISAAT